MPRKPIDFELDFMTKDIISKFTVKQFDDVTFNITPKKQGLDYDTTGMTGKIFIGINNDVFMQTTGITVSSNNINVLLDKNMLQKNGKAYAEIELTDSKGTISSSSFIFNIDPKIGEGATMPGSIEGFVAKYERLIAEFKSQINETINNCNTRVDNKLNTVDSLINVKISDFEKRFNRLTSSQQQDAEVIDARTDFKGEVFDSLKERIDYTDKLLRESTVSTVETESDFTTVEATSNGYFEDVKLEGKTLATVLTCSTNKNYAKWTPVDCVSYKAVEVGKVYTIIAQTNNTAQCGLKNRTSNDYLLALAAANEFICKTITFSKAEELIIVTDTEGTVNMELMILEGDHTQNPPSYFEGLKSVGDGADEIVVSSVNHILLNEQAVDEDWLQGMFTGGSANTPYASCKAINISGHKYLYSYYIYGNTLNSASYIVFFDKNKQRIGSRLTGVTLHTKIDIPNNACYVRLMAEVGEGKYTNTRLIASTKPLSMVTINCNKSDKKRLLFYNEETQTWEKPILREWDSIEKHADGKYYYHQRSGEVVLNGSENWGITSTDTNTIRFYTNLNNASTTNNVLIPAIMDKFTESTAISQDVEGFNLFGITNNTRIRISKTKLSTQDIEGFKAWLQANNVTVVYQLAQEKVYECTNIDLITYANETNYIVECGAIVPKTTLKVHNNISNVVSLLQKKVSLLESNITKYMITQNRMQLASTYSADSVTFKVDYALCSEETEEYNEDLYNLILNNILVGKDNYDYDKMFTMILDYASWNQISWEQFDILVGLMDMQHNPPIEEIPTDDEIVEEIPNEIM